MLTEESVVLCWILLGPGVISHFVVGHTVEVMLKSISSSSLQSVNTPAMGVCRLTELFKKQKKNQHYNGCAWH